MDQQQRHNFWETTMVTGPRDDCIQGVRLIRTIISAEHGNDAKRLVDHYMAEQQRYLDRMLKSPVSGAGSSAQAE